MVAPATRPQSRPAAKQSVACKDCPETNKPQRHIKVRASLFFDGTSNNRVNTAAHNAWERRPAGTRGRAPGSGSFENDTTNVAKLDWALGINQPGFDHAIKIYVEGIGTRNNRGDDLTGGGYGDGPTGIIAKVTNGLTELIPRIVNLVDDIETTTVEVHLDSFGFSRGAAAARHFIHRAMRHASDKVEKKLIDEQIKVTSVRMRFCGLFDTVSSHEPRDGLAFRVRPNFSDDVAALNLNAITLADKVVHLAAADEHRINFSLTNIASAGGKGQQIYLPGAHSDVGGGYNDGSPEIDNQVYDNDRIGATGLTAVRREKAWLISQGWYTDDELRVDLDHNEIYGTRRSISNHFARIPLQMMGEFAKGLQLAFDARLENGPEYIVPPALTAWHGTIKRLNAQVPTVYFNQAPPGLRRLRHDYLHFSAHYVSSLTDQGMQPRFTGDNNVTGRRWREVISG